LAKTYLFYKGIYKGNSMQQDISIRQLSIGSTYKIIWFGLVFSLVPFGALMGFFSLFGAHTVTWNHVPLTGISGLIAGPFVGLFLAVVFTLLFGTACAFGLWAYSKINNLKLRFVAIPVPADR
jgi:hypothetical protein